MTTTTHHEPDLTLDEHVLAALPDQPAVPLTSLREATSGQVVIAVRPAALTENLTLRQAAQVLDGNPRLYLVTDIHEGRILARPIVSDRGALAHGAGLSVGDFTIGADPAGASRHVLLDTGLRFEHLIAEVTLRRAHEQTRLAG